MDKTMPMFMDMDETIIKNDLRQYYEKCELWLKNTHVFLMKEVARKSLNESANDGTQQLALQISKHLDSRPKKA